MPQIGADDRPEVFEWWWGPLNQIANPETMPERGRITRIGAWLRGVSSSAGGSGGLTTYRLMLWNPAGSILYQGPADLVSSAAVNVANLVKIEVALDTPVELAEGQGFWVGFAWRKTESLQFGYQSGGGSHREKDGAWPPEGMSGASTHGSSGPVGAWAEYDPIAGAWVYRSGSWQRAESVYVRRGSSWEEADSVSVRRGSGWTEAD